LSAWFHSVLDIDSPTPLVLAMQWLIGSSVVWLSLFGCYWYIPTLFSKKPG